MSNSQISTLESPRSPAPAAQAKPQPVAKATAKVNGHDVALSGKKALVSIHPSDAEGGQEAVFLGLNGYAYQVPRGEPVSIPVELLEVLEHAIGERLIQDKDTNTSITKAPRFAYTVHDRDHKEAASA